MPDFERISLAEAREMIGGIAEIGDIEDIEGSLDTVEYSVVTVMRDFEAVQYSETIEPTQIFDTDLFEALERAQQFSVCLRTDDGERTLRISPDVEAISRESTASGLLLARVEKMYNDNRQRVADIVTALSVQPTVRVRESSPESIIAGQRAAMHTVLYDILAFSGTMRRNITTDIYHSYIERDGLFADTKPLEDADVQLWRNILIYEDDDGSSTNSIPSELSTLAGIQEYLDLLESMQKKYSAMLDWMEEELSRPD